MPTPDERLFLRIHEHVRRRLAPLQGPMFWLGWAFLPAAVGDLAYELRDGFQGLGDLAIPGLLFGVASTLLSTHVFVRVVTAAGRLLERHGWRPPAPEGAA